MISLFLGLGWKVFVLVGIGLALSPTWLGWHHLFWFLEQVENWGSQQVE